MEAASFSAAKRKKRYSGQRVQRFGEAKKLLLPKQKNSAKMQSLNLFSVGIFAPVGFESAVFVTVVDGDKYVGQFFFHPFFYHFVFLFVEGHLLDSVVICGDIQLVCGDYIVDFNNGNHFFVLRLGILENIGNIAFVKPGNLVRNGWRQVEFFHFIGTVFGSDDSCVEFCSLVV